MKEIHFSKGSEALSLAFGKGGAFLSADAARPNTMTIGWATVGVVWGKPMLIAMVRPSRHTYGLVKEKRCFTVSVPTSGGMGEQLRFAGQASGRDVDKFTGHGLTAAPAQKVDAPIVSECGLHFECVVRYDQDLDAQRMQRESLDRHYPEGDYHTMFYGEIVACYLTDE